MQPLLEYALFAVNIIGVIYLVVRDFSNQKGLRRLKEVDGRRLEQNRMLLLEVQSLRKQLDQQGQMIEGFIKQIKASSVEIVVPSETKKGQKAEHLLLNDRYKEIFELYEQGLNAEQIAKKLHKGYGEIAFILELARKGD